MEDTDHPQDIVFGQGDEENPPPPPPPERDAFNESLWKLMHRRQHEDSSHVSETWAMPVENYGVLVKTLTRHENSSSGGLSESTEMIPNMQIEEITGPSGVLLGRKLVPVPSGRDMIAERQAERWQEEVSPRREYDGLTRAEQGQPGEGLPPIVEDEEEPSESAQERAEARPGLPPDRRPETQSAPASVPEAPDPAGTPDPNEAGGDESEIQEIKRMLQHLHKTGGAQGETRSGEDSERREEIVIEPFIHGLAQKEMDNPVTQETMTIERGLEYVRVKKKARPGRGSVTLGVIEAEPRRDYRRNLIQVEDTYPDTRVTLDKSTIEQQREDAGHLLLADEEKHSWEDRQEQYS